MGGERKRNTFSSGIRRGGYITAPARLTIDSIFCSGKLTIQYSGTFIWACNRNLRLRSNAGELPGGFGQKTDVRRRWVQWEPIARFLLRSIDPLILTQNAGLHHSVVVVARLTPGLFSSADNDHTADQLVAASEDADLAILSYSSLLNRRGSPRTPEIRSPTTVDIAKSSARNGRSVPLRRRSAAPYFATVTASTLTLESSGRMIDWAVFAGLSGNP